MYKTKLQAYSVPTDTDCRCIQDDHKYRLSEKPNHSTVMVPGLSPTWTLHILANLFLSEEAVYV
jgi:hypothetical protein